MRRPRSPARRSSSCTPSQIGIGPPTIAIVANQPEAVPESYQRYLLRGFRDAWGFKGAPLRLTLNRRGSKR